MFPYMKLFIYLTLFLLVACSKPTDPGDYSRIRYCDLNGVPYAGIFTYEAYCNPEGVKLYDSLKKQDEFVSQFYYERECTDSLNHHFILHYNSYSSYFDLILMKGKSFNEMVKGHLYVIGQRCKFQTMEDLSSDSIRCLLVNEENEDLKIGSYISSELFPMDSIKILEEAESCEEQIAIAQSLFEMCEGRDLMK